MIPPLVYGPVPSRRLGYSLGVDLLPFKTCSLDCVYCQLGPSRRTTVRRREFVPLRAVLADIRASLRREPRIEAITFSGSGEPTLHAGLGKIIAAVKAMTDIPVVVLTNSSTLGRPAVRKSLAAADVVVPSLDAATERVFKKINRPHASLTAAKIIDGLAAFRKSYRGQVWLEILLVKGVNDGPAHLRALRRAIARIRPDRVQLNTVYRPPAERSARPLSEAELERLKPLLGEGVEIVAVFPENNRPAAPAALGPRLLELVGRRPETADGLARSLGATVAEVRRAAAKLQARGRVKVVLHDGREYFETSARG
jgi:wyosine [tRNA(Phe)-imidazoG37] synthetase (radical SAM superfamily)